ncbi:MAG: PGF-pre-PGF domain-containing protein [Methanolobus sp.]
MYVVDNEGNSESFSTTFIINEASISDSSLNTSSATSSTSSSGGGGGSGTTGEEYDNILIKEAQTIFVINDAHVTYEFTDEDNAISSVEFDSLKNSGSIQAVVEVLNDRSSFADSDAPGIVYQDINIWVGKSGFVSEENVENLLITFRVEKSWLTDNSLGSEGIALYRYDDDRWNKLETTVTGEDDTYVYFKSETPGFSPFAIASEFEPDISGDIAGEVLLMSINEPASAPLEKSELHQVEVTSSGVSSVGVIVLLGVISVFVAGGYILYRKQE